MHQTPVMVFDMKGAIKDRYQYMKDHGILKKDPEEAFFAKKFKGPCNKCGKQGHKGANCWSKKGKEGTEKTHREPISVCASSARRWDI